jgi:D-aminopeptidase
MFLQPGPTNLITDIAGLRVGNAHDGHVKTGTTVLIGDTPFVAGVHVMGGAPGTRETDLLAPDKTVQQVDALVLSGGSAFGLEAASSVANTLRSQGRGVQVGDQNVPIVPAAILFDLLNGGQKNWALSPYADLGRRALEHAKPDFKLGSAGAGYGATTANLKGGLGSASVIYDGFSIGALVAVNAVGSVIIGDGPAFWATPFEMQAEFGGHPMPHGFDPYQRPVLKSLQSQENTTIAIVATDAALTKAQATRMAIAAHDGIARAIYPAHTPMDGDLVFSAATGQKPLRDAILDPLMIGHAAALCLSRAIARGVFNATQDPTDTVPTYTQKQKGRA